MKKLLIVLILLGAGIFFYMKKTSQPSPAILSEKNVPKSAQKVTPSNAEADKSVFIPYWTVASEKPLDEYEEAYYFGIEADTNGIKRDEIGYSRINQFLDKTQGIKRQILVVRMVDKEVNGEVSKDPEAQKKIAAESTQIAKEHKFDGVMLDFEISSISFEEVTNRTTNFYTIFSEEVKKVNLLFYSALYGDTYYRVRAYDVKKIGELSDKVVIMSYDFHKSRGNPGPNFPLDGRETYGYDFKQMIEDFMNDVPEEKLEVAFGMFGYDWKVDNEDKATTSGSPLSTSEITINYIDSCGQKKCKWERDRVSQEIKAEYISQEDEQHIIWFEDNESTKRKKDYIQNIGISQVSYWAYSYY